VTVVDLRITGANELGDLARDLKRAGDKELRRDLMRGIQRAGKPLKEAAQRAALTELPKAGGLNEFVASGKFSVRTRTAGRNPGVRLSGAKAGHDIRAIDLGRLRHPVFGGGTWVSQSIKPGWWSDTLSDARVLTPVRQELLQVFDDVARRLARG
jgi:hypothetical protein